MADLVPYPIMPAPAPYERRETNAGEKTGKDQTSTTLSEEQKTAFAASDAVAAQEEAQIRKEQAGKDKIADAEAQGAADQARIAKWEADQLNSPAAQAARKQVEDIRLHTADQEARFDRTPAPALFADRKGWDKVKLAVAMGLGGLSEGMIAAAHLRLGMAAPQQHTVDGIIERDIQRQIANIDKIKDSVAMARTGLKNATDAKAALRADVELRGKSMYKNAEMLMRGRLVALKKDQNAIESDGRIIEVRNRQAEKKLNYVQTHSDIIKNTFDSAQRTVDVINRVPAPSPENRAGAVPGAQAALARQVIDEVANLRTRPDLSENALQSLQSQGLRSEAADESIQSGPIRGLPASIGRAVGLVPKSRYEGLSVEERKTAASMDSMVQALTHVMTGAGATLSEATKKANTFGFVPGETAATIQDKLTRAEQLAQKFTEPGRRPADAPAAPSAPAPAPAPPAPPRGRSVGGSAPPPRRAPATRADLARQALKDPEATPAEKARAREILKADLKGRR